MKQGSLARGPLGTSGRGRAARFAPMDAGVSALAVGAHPKVVAEPRFAPDGGPAGLARGHRRPSPSSGRARRRLGAAGDRDRRPHARRRRRLPRRDVVLGRRRARRGGDAGRRARGGAGRRRSGDGRGPRRPRRRARRRPRRPDPLRLRAGRRARRRRDLGRRPRLAAALVPRRLRLGSRDLGRRPLGRLARVGPRRDVVDGVAHRARRPARRACPAVVAGGPHVSVGQPRFSPDGRVLAYVSDETGWWNVHVAGGRRHRRAPAARGAARPRRAGVGSGPALVRVVAGVGRDRAVPQRGRLRAARRRRARRRGHRGRARVAPRHRLGTGRHRRGALRCAHAAAGHDRRSRRRRAPRASRAARRPGIEDGAREPEIVTWRVGRRHRLRAPVPPRRRRPPAPPPLLVDLHGGPTGQAVVRWDGWLRYFTSRGFAVLRPNPRGSTGFGRAFVQDHAAHVGRRRRRRRRRRDRGGRPGGLGRPGPGRGRRRERRRTDRAARVRPARPPRARRGVGLRRHRPLRPRPDHPPVRVALPRRDRRAAARRRRPRTATARRSRTPPRSRAPLLVLQGDADPVVPPAAGAAARRRGARRGRDGRAPRLRGRGPRLVATRDGARTSWSARGRSSNVTWSTHEGASHEARVRVPGAEARRRTRRRPRGAARARRRRRHARGDADDRHRRAERGRRSRACGSSTRTGARARRRPTVPAVLLEATRTAVAELARRTKLPDRAPRARRPVDGRSLLLARRRATPTTRCRASVSCCSATRCTRRASRRRSAATTSRGSRCRCCS